MLQVNNTKWTDPVLVRFRFLFPLDAVQSARVVQTHTVLKWRLLRWLDGRRNGAAPESWKFGVRDLNVSCAAKMTTLSALGAPRRASSLGGPVLRDKISFFRSLRIRTSSAILCGALRGPATKSRSKDSILQHSAASFRRSRL